MSAAGWDADYEGGLPSIEELTGRPADPGETLEEVRHALGIGARRVRYPRNPDLPDVSGLAEMLREKSGLA